MGTEILADESNSMKRGVNVRVIGAKVSIPGSMAKFQNMEIALPGMITHYGPEFHVRAWLANSPVLHISIIQTNQESGLIVRNWKYDVIWAADAIVCIGGAGIVAVTVDGIETWI